MSTQNDAIPSDLFGSVLSQLGGTGRSPVVGAAGGGAVKVTMLGMQRVEQVEINADALEDVALLEDLLAAAMNDALEQARASTQQAAMGLFQQLSRE